jgi:ankyrin
LAALLQGFDQVDIPDRLGNAPIHVAAKCGNYEVIELLMKRQANIKASNFKGSLPLHLAAEAGQVAVIRLLCEGIKEVNVLNSFGYSPLHCAAKNGHLEAVRVLLHEGAMALINQKNKDGNTALHSAVMSGNIQIVQELLAVRAAVDIQNNENCTPLMLLALNPRVEHIAEMCEMLLDARANHTISRAQFAQNAFALACMNGNQTVIRKLLVKRDIPVMEIQSGIFAAHISGHKQLASNLEKVLQIILDRQFADMPPLEPIGS